MAKILKRNSLQDDEDQAGCMGGFISIFDFRPGRSTHKLLSDRRCTGREGVGAGHSRPKLLLTNSNGNSPEKYVSEERDNLIAAKTSVKELMEEEMTSEQDQKRQMSSADIGAKVSLIECSRRHIKQNGKQTRKTSKSSDTHFEFDAAENTCHQHSEENNSKFIDMEVVMNELYQQLYQKHPEKAYSVFDDELIKKIKVFVDQTSKHVGENGKDNHLGDVEAFQTFSSKKELILNVLKDKNSLLVKHIEDLMDGQLDGVQSSKLLEKFDWLDGEVNKSKPSKSVACRQHRFFKRRSKSQEKILLKEDENFQNSNRIVILKPGPASLQISGTAETKMQAKKTALQLSFTQLRRKLKSALGKERHMIPSDNINHTTPCKDLNSRRSDKSTGSGQSSHDCPNRTHFYTENFARPKTKSTQTSIGNEISEDSNLRISKIYDEAKKHLSELLTNGEEIEVFSNRQSPKALERLLSYSDFHFSPACSPRRDREHTFVTPCKSLSPCKNLHVVIEENFGPPQNKYVGDVCPSRENLDRQQRISNSLEDVQYCKSSSDTLTEFNCANAEEETSRSMRSEKSFESDVEIVETTSALAEGDNKVSDLSAEQCSCPVITEIEIGDLIGICNGDESAQGLKLDSVEVEEVASSPLTSQLGPLTSPPNASITKHIGDVESAGERAEQRSPVSALEPLFIEYEIMPTSIRSQPVEPPNQRQSVQFEEQLSSVANQEIEINVEGEESAFEYVEAVLLASDLNWEEFLARWLSSDQILDVSLFDEVELFSSRSHDQKLLFDCTNEVLKEICDCYLGNYLWLSFLQHNIQPVMRGKALIDEVWKRVEFHLLPQPSHHTLDHIMKKDMEKKRTRMDLQFDVQSICIDIEEAILEELLEDLMLSFENEGFETDSCVILED
ncbi:hypothetical protein NMG60_11022857 [Bertholletia excelsa]